MRYNTYKIIWTFNGNEFTSEPLHAMDETSIIPIAEQLLDENAEDIKIIKLVEEVVCEVKSKCKRYNILTEGNRIVHEGLTSDKLAEEFLIKEIKSHPGTPFWIEEVN